MKYPLSPVGVRPIRISKFLSAGILIAAAAQSATADDRRFTFVDETRTTAKGAFEYEQWVTWQKETKADHTFNRFDFKHELEYGLTDKMQIAVDLAEWHFQTGDETDGPRYDETSAEFKVRFLDPVTDAVGLGYKMEVGIGPEQLGWENRLIVDKMVGKFDLAYNLKLEAEWGGESYFKYDEDGGELSQSCGASYEITPSKFVGIEALHEIPMPDWKTGEHQNVFLGPNFSYRGTKWAITTTLLTRVTGGDDEPLFQLRALFEIDF